MTKLFEVETSIDKLLKKYEKALKDNNKAEEVRICLMIEQELSKLPSNEIKLTTENNTIN